MQALAGLNELYRSNPDFNDYLADSHAVHDQAAMHLLIIAEALKNFTPHFRRTHTYLTNPLFARLHYIRAELAHNHDAITESTMTTFDGEIDEELFSKVQEASALYSELVKNELRLAP